MNNPKNSSSAATSLSLQHIRNEISKVHKRVLQSVSCEKDWGFRRASMRTSNGIATGLEALKSVDPKNLSTANGATIQKIVKYAQNGKTLSCLSEELVADIVKICEKVLRSSKSGDVHIKALHKEITLSQEVAMPMLSLRKVKRGGRRTLKKLPKNSPE